MQIELSSTMQYNNTTTKQPFTLNDSDLDSNKLLQNVQVAQLSIFAFVFVLGVWGNIIVIVTIFTHKALRSSSNYFIANLAVSDLGGLCLSMPLAALDHLADWPFGDVACRFINPLKDLFLHVSMVTLTAIAVDRYVHIAHPFTPNLSSFKVKLVIVLIWLVDYLLVPLPMAFVMGVQSSGTGITMCFPMWSAQHRRIAIICLASIILLSLFVMAFAYLGVGIALTQQRKRIVQRAQRSGVEQEPYRRQLEKNAKTVKVMVVIVIAFWFSALPLTLFGLLSEFEMLKLTLTEVSIASSATITLLFFQNCMNPIILYVLSKEMRSGFVGCVKCRRRRDDKQGESLTKSRNGVNTTHAVDRACSYDSQYQRGPGVEV